MTRVHPQTNQEYTLEMFLEYVTDRGQQLLYQQPHGIEEMSRRQGQIIAYAEMQRWLQEHIAPAPAPQPKPEPQKPRTKKIIKRKEPNDAG